VPNLRRSGAINTLEPRPSAVLLEEIEERVAGRASSFATVHAIQPVFERLRVEANVVFDAGRDPGYYAGVLNDDLKRFLKFYGELVGGLAKGGRSIRYRALHKNGDWIWLESNPRLVKSAIAGELDDIIDVTREVTEQQALKEQLDDALAQAEQAAAVKGEFLANMSHEIRTPLNGVLAMAEVMSLGELGDVQRERLGIIRQSGSLLLAVLNDVLDLSKIEAVKLSLVTEDFNLASTLTPTAETFQVLAKGKGLDFNFSIAEAAQGWWRGDADRLRQIVGNLLSNAVKFTPEGGRITIRAREAAGWVSIAIADTGIGIPEDALARLGRPFEQVESQLTKSHQGSGLGLAIAKSLTELHHGSMRIRSTLGHGTMVLLRLPLGRTAAQREDVAEAAA